MRTKQHYEKILSDNPDTTIGFSLAADMVYAARHDVINRAEAHSGDEWRGIARNLKNLYGDSLTVDQVRHEISPIKSAAAVMGRKGGKSRSERKQAAARENGKKGGRPKKTQEGRE
jgi:hypothetical protein